MRKMGKSENKSKWKVKENQISIWKQRSNALLKEYENTGMHVNKNTINKHINKKNIYKNSENK